MAKKKRTIWDDLAEIGQEMIERLDEALNPERKRPKPARVPVPVRNDIPRDYYQDR